MEFVDDDTLVIDYEDEDWRKQSMTITRTVYDANIIIEYAQDGWVRRRVIPRSKDDSV